MGRRSNPMVRAAMKAYPSSLAGEVVKSFDVVGDVAVIKVPPKLMDGRFRLAEALLEELPNVKVVLRQTSPHLGDYRVRGVEWLAGERRTTTIYSEHGCRFKVDLAKVYFSPRLSYERMRVAGLVEEEEEVFNMFAGVGCFSVMIAKHRGATVYSVDINPDAAKYMHLNVKLNKVHGKVHVLLGDSRFIALSSLKGRMDRVLMPLPLRAYDYLDAAVQALKRRGFIHYYDVEEAKTKRDALSKVELKVARRLRDLKVGFKISSSRVVREVGPRAFQVVLDLEVEKLV
ncbi:MAG: class I SAM-dependent methyltransferase family protein [Thermoprotei archaeon]|nr:MAG: class I SAM-dependent methyltransferase family protein [Thermoprotei archaeon]